MSVRLVNDGCLNCGNLSRIVEFGVCSCENEYAKGKSQAELSWLARHGKNRKKLLEIQKPLRHYSMEEIEEPLIRISVAMENLVNEGEKLCTVTKAVSQNAQRHKRRVKVRNSKENLKSTVSNMERSKADFEQGRKKSLKKSDDLILLNVLDYGMKGIELENWIEKRAGVR